MNETTERESATGQQVPHERVVMRRPDYVHCVGFGNAVRTDRKITWCGNDHELNPFFQDVTHAALNGELKGRLVVCPECLKAITDALNNGCA